MNISNLSYSEKRELLELIGGRKNLDGFNFNDLSPSDKKPFIQGLGKETIRDVFKNPVVDIRDRFVDAGTGAYELLDAASDKPARQLQRPIQSMVRGAPQWLGGGQGSALTRFAGSPVARRILQAAPVIAGVGGVLGAADVIAGPDSLGNKVMDTAGMTIGGVLGAVGGPMGVAAGAGVGKAASDSLQWLFGDKKTAEQRQMAQALAGLQGGRF